MSKRFWTENGEILDCGFFLSGEQQYVDVMNNLDQQIAELKAENEKLQQQLKEKDEENATLEAMLAENANDRKTMQEFKIGEDEYDLTDEDARNSLCWEVEELKQQLAESEKKYEDRKQFCISEIRSRTAIINNLLEENEELQQQLKEKDEENAICKLRQHNKDLLSIIRSQKRELAEKGRAVGRRNNHIVQLQKELDNAIYQVCKEIREFVEQPENSIFYDESLYVETEGLRKLLDKLEKGEENESLCCNVK